MVMVWEGYIYVRIIHVYMITYQGIVSSILNFGIPPRDLASRLSVCTRDLILAMASLSQGYANAWTINRSEEGQRKSAAYKTIAKEEDAKNGAKMAAAEAAKVEIGEWKVDGTTQVGDEAVDPNEEEPGWGSHEDPLRTPKPQN